MPQVSILRPGIRATDLDWKPTLPFVELKWSDCLKCQELEVEFGCGKDVDEVHLENALRFPLSPNAAAAEGSGSQRDRASGLG